MQLNKYLDDVHVIKTCYEYFKSIEGLDAFGKIPIPSTEYQDDLKEVSVQFGIRLKNLKIDGLENYRSNTSRGWRVDIEKLHDFFLIEKEAEIQVDADANLFDEY